MSSLYTPLFIYILIAIVTAVAMLTISAVINPGRRSRSPVKQMPYESGMDPIGDARQRFDIRYHLVAIAFLLFDVELLFLYPWAAAQWRHSSPPVSASTLAVETGPVSVPAAYIDAGIPPQFRTIAFLGALLFIAIVVAGFAYDWRKGVFEWR
jgi:NADH-quinone oxidoreductase subunit A